MIESFEHQATLIFEDLRPKVNRWIGEHYSDLLDVVPEGATEVDAPPWEADSPALSSKVGTTLYWINRVTLKRMAYSWGPAADDPVSASRYLTGLDPYLDYSRNPFLQALWQSAAPRLPEALKIKQFEGSGWFLFTVSWTTELSGNGLSNPEIRNVSHIWGQWSSTGGATSYRRALAEAGPTSATPPPAGGVVPDDG